MRKSLKRGTWKGLELFLGGVWGGFWERFGTSLAFLGALLSEETDIAYACGDLIFGQISLDF